MPEEPMTTGTMTAETIPLGQHSHAQSLDLLTLRTESTVFSLAHTESLWTTAPPPRAFEFYRHAILLMSTGGSVLLVGLVLSGLYFAGFSKFSGIMGPALLSIGLMVLMVGLVLIPVTREMKKHAMKKLYTCYKPQQIQL
ncbi:phosphoinositide-interacting protein [Clupea harengus]|uniref:Phosphoinositide-interacting protein n=1 Tax=Clupea harengus TaxID=7950 RepID=A0A6P3VTW6_CLUHA|nr:phosphoinositide-interacting protein [Clupea harengus]